MKSSLLKLLLSRFLMLCFLGRKFWFCFGMTKKEGKWSEIPIARFPETSPGWCTSDENMLSIKVLFTLELCLKPLLQMLDIMGHVRRHILGPRAPSCHENFDTGRTFTEMWIAYEKLCCTSKHTWWSEKGKEKHVLYVVYERRTTWQSQGTSCPVL